MSMDNTVNWAEIRALFPMLQRYTYLNAAESGPLSIPVCEAGKGYYEESLQQADMNWDAWVQRMEAAREAVALYLNADKDEIAFTLSASHGMNLIADMLKGKGSVLTMEEEFPSSTLPWLHRNIPLRFVSAQDMTYPIESIAAEVREDTRIIVSSHVQYKTGFRQDINGLGALCKERDLIFVLNATQSMGVAPIDVKKAHVDFLVFNSLKWVLAGYGIGILYINRKWLARNEAPVAGWLSVTDPFAMNNLAQDLRMDASAWELGCPHVPNIFALGAAMDLLNSIGPERILTRILVLNRHLEQRMEELRVEIISPRRPEHRSGITMIKVKEPQQMVDQLRTRGVVVSRRGEAVRVSVHFFNNEADIDVFASALRELL